MKFPEILPGLRGRLNIVTSSRLYKKANHVSSQDFISEFKKRMSFYFYCAECSKELVNRELLRPFCPSEDNMKKYQTEDTGTVKLRSRVGLSQCVFLNSNILR